MGSSSTLGRGLELTLSLKRELVLGRDSLVEVRGRVEWRRRLLMPEYTLLASSATTGLLTLWLELALDLALTLYLSLSRDLSTCMRLYVSNMGVLSLRPA